MPSDAPAIKRERVEADGAEVVIVGTGVRRAAARSPRRSPPSAASPIIPPYDDDRIIAGQGTVGLEIVEDLPDVAAVLVPIGGGGLASGVAAAVRPSRRTPGSIGVEPELAADARESLARGEIVRWAADRGVAHHRRRHAHPGHRRGGRSRTCAPTSTAIVTVSEAEIAAGVRLAAERARLVVEPSARWRSRRSRSSAAEAGLDGLDGPVVAVVSGGNVDPDAYRAYLAAPLPD